LEARIAAWVRRSRNTLITDRFLTKVRGIRIHAKPAMAPANTAEGPD
jgi:hypothetical protein